jgi:hypothetical protein
MRQRCRASQLAGVERHRVRSLAQPDGPRAVVDVVYAQAADLEAGRSVHQGEDPEQGLVRVSVRGRCPAAEKLAVPGQQDGLSGEPGGLPGGQPAGRVSEHDLLGPGERKNWRRTVSRRLRPLGRAARNASMSCTPASTQSRLPSCP